MRKKKISFLDEHSTASAFVFRVILNYMQKKGLNVDSALRRFTLPEGVLNCVDTRLPVLSYYQLFGYAVAQTEDHNFGYNLGLENDEGNDRDLLKLSILNSKKLGDAIEIINLYSSFLVSDIKVETIEQGSFLLVRIDCTCPNKLIIRHITEAYFSQMLRLIDDLTDESVSPVKIFFNFKKPASKTLFEEEFQVPLGYEHNESVMVFNQHVKDIPVSFKDENLIKTYRKKIDDVKSGFDPEGLTVKVAELLAGSIHEGREMTIKEIAEKLSLSVKVLQRELKHEGEPFHKVSDNVKKDLALGYIRNMNIPVNEIAHMLGFEDISVFKYKFRHWTGQDIDSYRQLN